VGIRLVEILRPGLQQLEEFSLTRAGHFQKLPCIPESRIAELKFPSQRYSSGVLRARPCPPLLILSYFCL